MLGGEAPGKLEMLKIGVDRALVYADSQFLVHQKMRAIEVMPAFRSAFIETKERLREAMNYQRSEMPVLEDEDLFKIRSLLEQFDAGPLCEVCTAKVGDLWPVQSQVYFDKSINNTARFGIPSTKQFLGSKHLYVADGLEILDGHHRWLSGCFIDANMSMKLFKFPCSPREVLPMLVEFSDREGRARNG
jgi:hypothetical protein